MINKYKNTKTIVDDIKFDSKLEARAYVYLRDNPNYLIYVLQPKFELQPKFVYDGKTIRAINYVADFLIAYRDVFYVVDAKGVETPEFKIKMKMFKHKRQNHLKLVLFKSIKQFEEEIKKF